MSAGAIPNFDEWSKQRQTLTSVPNFDQFVAQRNNSPTPKELHLGEQPASFSGVARGMASNAVDAGTGAVKGIGRSIADVGGMAINPFGQNPIANAIEKKTGIGAKIHSMTEPTNTAQTIGSYLPDAALMLAPGGAVSQGAKMFPNAASAGRKFELALQAAKDVPVDVTKFAQPVLRAKTLNTVAGDPMAPVLKKALAAIGPTTEPLTYGNARILASSAGRKAQQTAMGGTLTGEMGKRLAQTAKGLDLATAEAAGRAGVGPIHNEAMREYRNAMLARQILKTGAKIAAPIALGGIGYKIAHGLGYLGE